MSWYKTGYGATKEAYDYSDKDGGGPRRHWQPPEVTNRVLFLDDDPMLLWEHNYQYNGSWKQWDACLVRNKIEAQCYFCERWPDKHPYFIGFHSVINMTPWKSKKGNVYCYQRELFGARLGGRDRPGILKELERLRLKYGRLRGLVFDVYRSGKLTESCGDKFDLVEKIEPAAIAEFRDEHLRAHLAKINADADADKKVTMDQLLKRNPWEPWNWSELLGEGGTMAPKTYAQQKAMFANGGGSKGSESQGARSGGGDSDFVPDDFGGDDIPF